MKVVHLVPAMEQGGVETVVCDLVKALGTWESVVVSKGGRLVEKIERAGGRHVALDLKSKNPLTYLSRVLKLRRILRQEKPDLVCVHSRVPAWIYVGVRALDSAIRKVKRSSDPTIQRSNDPAIQQSNNQTIQQFPPPWITYAHGANSVSRYSEVMTKGDLVITPSRFLADYLKANYGLSESKIRIVPNAVDTERFDPVNLDLAFIGQKRHEWGIREGDHVIMAIGRITPVKGLDGLIKEVCEGRFQSSNVKLVIVGGADRHHQKYLRHLKELASAVHLSHEPSSSPSPSSSPVVFAGPQAKIPECLAIADEVVSANVTKPETFGLSVVEAYAMNRPVRVLRRFGGVAEVMDAVEKSGCATLREAVRKLYGIDGYAERTQAVYRDATV